MSAIAAIVPDDRDGAAIAASLQRLTGRSVELVIAPAEISPAAMRNRALRRAHAPYVTFLDEPPTSSFYDAAARLLDARPELAFVTGWGDAVPSRLDPEPRPATVKALIGRPWFGQVPTVFRHAAWHQVGGFDERLDGVEELDLWLRLLGEDRGGLVVETPELRHAPWGPAPPASAREPAARRLFEKHRALFERELEGILLARERTVRELVDRTGALHRALAALDR